MHFKAVTEVLASELREIINSTSKEVVKTLPSEMLSALTNKSVDFLLSVNSVEEYEDLLATMLNYPTKPSPAIIYCKTSAYAVLSDSKLHRPLLAMLPTASTHVLKALDAGYKPLMIIDNSPAISPDEAMGVCRDTVNDSTEFNIGGNAADAAFIPFWLAKFKLLSGDLTNNLRICMGLDGVNKQQLFKDTLVKLGGSKIVEQFDEILSTFPADGMPYAAEGKVVLFPLGPEAAQGDQYLSISPVPSAGLLIKFSTRYYAETREYSRKTKEKQELHVFNYPEKFEITIGGAKPQNCGSAVQAISGKAKAFRAIIGSLPIELAKGGEGYLIRALQSRRDLLKINDWTLDYLSRTLNFRRIEQNWKNRLPEVIADVLLNLFVLREKGLPEGTNLALGDFRHRIEGQFVTHQMAGDIAGRHLTPDDLNEFAMHVCRQLNSRLIRRDSSLGLPADRQALVYEIIVSLLR